MRAKGCRGRDTASMRYDTDSLLGSKSITKRSCPSSTWQEVVVYIKPKRFGSFTTSVMRLKFMDQQQPVCASTATNCPASILAAGFITRTHPKSNCSHPLKASQAAAKMRSPFPTSLRKKSCAKPLGGLSSEPVVTVSR